MSSFDEPNHLNQVIETINKGQGYSDDEMKSVQYGVDPFDCRPGSVEQVEAYHAKIDMERKENEFSVFCDSLGICWEQMK